ncbi:MAG: DUF935 family protein [Phycisphaerae bacterium]|nr:DUF935 family protein [Phycisphaerae bacterium]
MLTHARQRLAAVLKSLGSLLSPAGDQQQTAATIVRPWRDDATREYPTLGLTPSRALGFLQNADAGMPRLQFELFDEMLQKWPRLAAVEATRRLALTGLEWEVTSTAAGDNDAAVTHCQSVLSGLDRFREALDHLANAIAYGIAVAELVWEDGQLVDIVPVPFSRLMADPNQPWRLRVRTENEPSLGIALDEQPTKWIVHRPRPRPGRHFDAGLMRASVALYVAQNLSFKDWLIYSQIAGMPVRVARFDPGTSDADKKALVKMLASLGTDAVAAFSKNVDLKFMEAGSGQGKPYQALQEYCNTEITILWLGQHLTTDIKQTGSRAAAEVHDRVREDLLVDDIGDEGATIRRDLLTPLVRARFGAGVQVPGFRRSLVQAVDTKVLADTLAVAVNDLGMEIPRRWLHTALGVPEARAGEATIQRRSDA